MKIGKYVLLTILSFIVTNCTKPPEVPSEIETSDSQISEKYLYISTGACQAGQNTTFTTATATNRVYRVSTVTGQLDRIIADYTSVPATTGDSPVSIAPYDESSLLVLVERTGARRVEKVSKDGSTDRSSLTTDASLLSNALLEMTPIKTGGFYISKTNAIAKMSSAGISQATTFVNNAPGGACGAANNKYAAIESTLLGHLFFVNSVASNNRMGIILNSGTTCLAGLPAPQATAYPSAVLRIPDRNQFLVAYAGNTTTADINSIQVYDVTETASTASISAPTKIYDYAGINSSFALYAIPYMAFDPSDNSLYVATAISNATTVVNYNIEKFSYDPDTKTLTKPVAALFRPYSLDSKCISGMFVE